MNPYFYLFRKYFNGYMIIALILLICYFVRVRNLYMMEHYKNVMKTNTKRDIDTKKRESKSMVKKGKTNELRNRKTNNMDDRKSNKIKKKKNNTHLARLKIDGGNNANENVNEINEGFATTAATTITTPVSSTSSTPISDRPRTKIQQSHKLLQPCYENKLDEIYQTVHNNLDGQESNLQEEYNKAYQEFLEKEKKDKYNINPLKSLADFEDRIYNLIDGDGLYKDYNKDSFENKKDFSYYQKTIGNYIPNNTNSKTNTNINTNTRTNSYTNTRTIEGFTTTTKKSETTSKDSDTSSSEQYNMTNLLSGDMISNVMQYGLNTVNSTFNTYANSSNNISEFVTNENNMMPIGILMIILSLMLYFADITS